MAQITPKAVIDGLIPFMGDRPLTDSLRMTLLNMAVNHFSVYADWRWLTRTADEITLTNTQIYDWESSSPILKVIYVQLINRGKISVLPPASVVPTSDEGQSTLPSTFEFLPQSGNDGRISLWPIPPVGVSAKIVPIEKKKNVRIVEGNLEDEDVLEHPDEYNHIFEFFLLDLMYMWAQVGPQTAVIIGQQRSAGVSGALARAHAAADKIMPTEAVMYDPKSRGFGT